MLHFEYQERHYTMLETEVIFRFQGAFSCTLIALYTFGCSFSRGFLDTRSLVLIQGTSTSPPLSSGALLDGQRGATRAMNMGQRLFPSVLMCLSLSKKGDR